MLEIYFDGVLIDSNMYKALTNDFVLLNDEFKLGSTSSNAFKLEIPSTVDIPKEVIVRVNDNDYAHLIVDSYELVNDKYFSLSLVDKMLSFNFNYDASAIVPCTVLDIILDICSKVGVELGSTDFINCNNEVDWYDNRLSAREYISYIAECASGFASIGQDGKLYIKKFIDRPEFIIDMNTCEEFKIKEYHTVERVVFDNGILKFETSDDEELETLYLNSKNVFINNEDIFNNIVNGIIGFSYYCFETGKCEINSNVIAGDKLIFTDGINSYNSIAQYKLNFNGKFLGGYSFSVSSKKQQETKQSGIKEQVKNLDISLNRIENELKINIEEINDTNSKLNQTIYSVDETNQTISQTGGLNLLQNTSGYFDLDKWVKSDNLKYSISVYPEVRSNSKITVNDGWFEQSFIQDIGKEYTIAFKYKKQQVFDNTSGVLLYLNPDESISILNVSMEVSDIKEVSYTYIATVNSPKIRLFSNNSDFEIYDLVIQGGTSTVWSPAAREVIGINHKLNVEGLHITDLSKEKNSSHLDSDSLVYKQDNVEKAHYGATEAKVDVVKTNRIEIGNISIVCLNNNIQGIG